jgi:hypothetical protein
MSEQEFVPVVITGCDEEKVRRASGSKKNFLVPFTLSAAPRSGWANQFDEQWREIRKKAENNRRIKAFVRKQVVILECSLDSIKPLFPELKQAVDATNEQHGEVLKEKAEKNAKKIARRQKERDAERTAIHEALEGIDFS